MRPVEINDRIKARLPHGTQRIINVLGWEAAFDFLVKNGGREVYIPQKLSENCKVFDSMTNKQVTAMINEFRGENIKVPTYRKMMQSEQYQRMVLDYERGVPVSVIAKFNRRHFTKVHKILASFGIKKSQ